jgi:hypothetical protein
MFTAAGERLGAASFSTRTFLSTGSRPFWIATVVLTLFTWPFGIGPVGASLDFSWIAGLYMAVDEGRHFGTEIVYTFGPLGFLAWPSPWIGSLAVLAFGYWIVTYGGLIAVLTWSLSRTVGLVAAAVIVLAVSLTFGFLNQLPLVLAVGLCLIALREDRPTHGVSLLAYGGGLLCAVEPLVKLSVGPPVILIVLLAMIGARADRRQWTGFLGTAVVSFFVLWFATGQGLGNLWAYVDNGAQIVKGYGEAMGYDAAETWEVVVIVVAAIALIAGIHRARFRDTRAKWFATAITVVVAYTVFKYGTTQFAKGGPPVAAMSSLFAIFLMAPWPRRLGRVFVAATLIFGAVILHAFGAGPGAAAGVDVIARFETFKESVEFAIRPGLRHQEIDEARESVRTTLAVPPPVLEALAGKTVAIEPWEITLAWAYELDWKPLPVFQNYQDYTQKLDRLNAAAAKDAENGPQALLRQMPAGTVETGGRPAIFERQPAWDPPEQSLADFCNFVPTLTEGAWQVLSRIPDRCGEPMLVTGLTVDPGQTFQIPQARNDEIVIMRVHGAKLEGLEKLAALFWRPSERHAVVNGGEYSYRLPPDTTEDPMIVSADRKLGHGPELPELPLLHKMRLEGASGPFEVDFYRVELKEKGS